MTTNDIEEIEGLGRAALAAEFGANSPGVALPKDSPFRMGAEIGVQKGEYAEMILRSSRKRLLLVDLWGHQANYKDIANVSDLEHLKNLRETVQRMAAFPFQSVLRIGASVEVAREVADGSLDFVYIDADHKYSAVKADLAAWFPKVRFGGIIAGHDYLDSSNCCGSEFGVRTAVREFCALIGVAQVSVCRTEPFPNWHFIKPHFCL